MSDWARLVVGDDRPDDGALFHVDDAGLSGVLIADEHECPIVAEGELLGIGFARKVADYPLLAPYVRSVEDFAAE